MAGVMEERGPIQPNWKKHALQIMAAEDLQGVVIIAIERDGTVSSHTYGEDRLKCRALAKWIEFFDRNLSIVPFQTIFGWGNGGKPKRVDIGTPVPTEWLEFSGWPVEPVRKGRRK